MGTGGIPDGTAITRKIIMTIMTTMDMIII